MHVYGLRAMEDVFHRELCVILPLSIAKKVQAALTYSDFVESGSENADTNQTLVLFNLRSNEKPGPFSFLGYWLWASRA